MLSNRVNFSIESGDFDTGFPVILHCFGDDQSLILLERGQLPPNPKLLQKYQRWKVLYLQWGRSFRLEPILDEPINISFFERVQRSALSLEQGLNEWLRSDCFAPLLKILYQQLSSSHPTDVFLHAQNLQILRLPWSCLTLLDEFPGTNFVLAPTTYTRMELSYPQSPSVSINLLAVLTGGDEVDTHGDRHLLEALPQTYLKVVRSPTRRQMTDSLWQRRWDILFFAGHSSSDRGEGKFIIAQDQWMAPSDMKFAIQRAAKQGLKLAIFNSCDGLAIAQELVQNDVPFIITMREPVPDEVAHTFLSYFLSAYSTGQSLFQAFQEAQKRLESLEDLCPCATWLPVLVCNPLVKPPSWSSLLGQFPQSPPSEALTPLRQFFSHRGDLLGCMSLMMLILLGRSVGVMQGLELWSFDQLMRRRPPETQDSRLLIVEIDEAAIQKQKSRTGSISDQALNQVIQVLSRHQAKVIGLDVYRDDRQLEGALQTTFETVEQVIGICKSPDLEFDSEGVSSPLRLPVSRLGFSDVLEDPDGVVLRQLLFMNSSPTKTCATPWSLSSALALRYLAQDQAQPSFTRTSSPKDQRLLIGEQVFPSIRGAWGGYQTIDSRGNQIMLNYRSLPQLRNIAEIVKLDDVLRHEVSAESIRDRVVLIGVTANTSTDFWETPYGSTGREKLPGVFLQAHMVSQLISAVKDLRPLIYTWPNWLDMVWVMVWGLFGFGIPRHLGWRQWGFLMLLTISLVFLCFWGLLAGLWLPLIPSLMALIGMGLYRRKGRLCNLPKRN